MSRTLTRHFCKLQGDISEFALHTGPSIITAQEQEKLPWFYYLRILYYYFIMCVSCNIFYSLGISLIIIMTHLQSKNTFAFSLHNTALLQPALYWPA